MAGDIALLIPVLRRPHNAKPLYESAMANTPGGHVVFLCSPNDRAEQAACEATGATVMVISEPVRFGDYQRKINFGYRHTTEPLIFTGADDIRFSPGWLDAVREKIIDGAHVVGTNDLGNARVMRGEHATHLVITRRYVKEFGTIDEPDKVLHEGYPHEFCDDEAVGTAKFRGVWAMALDAHVEHLHPNWGKAPSDELYAAQRQRMIIGRRLYLQRRRLWEG